MNLIRIVAVATTFAIVTGAPLAGAADTAASMAITGVVTPGVYGQVETASKTSLPLVYEQPLLIDPPESAGKVEPVYVHVPPEHAKNWKKFCSKYQACNRPVFFVKSAEYEPGYEPPKPEKEKSAKRKFRSGF